MSSESSASPVPDSADASRNSAVFARKFFVNILWTWVGVGASFFTGFFLSPYIIRKLGDHRYGLWALAFAFIDYFTLFDFGFKAAVVNFVSRARVESDETRINEIVNTSFFYFTAIGVFLFTVTYAIAGHLDLVLNITPQYKHEFVVLIRLIAVGWSISIALNVFNAGMEAFQEFKTQNSISAVSLMLRSGGCALAVFFGYGLETMGVIVLVTQVFTFSMLFLGFRRAFPRLRISPSFIRPAVWKDLARYGVHAFVAYVAIILLNQGPTLMVGHFMNEAFVGYYSLPSRLLQNAVDLITRIGNVTVPNTADLAARDRHSEIVQLGRYLNRYSLALFAPLSIFLLAFGRDLIGVWVGAKFAAESGPLIPPFILMTTLAVAGQFNSSQILFGLAKHKLYARALFLEGSLSLGTMAFVIPRYGIQGAAWVAAAFAVTNRGIVTPWLLSRTLHFNVFAYMRDIYLAPCALIAGQIALVLWLKWRFALGHSWPQLIGSLALIAIVFYAACYFTIVDRGHRVVARRWISGYIARGRRTV